MKAIDSLSCSSESLSCPCRLPARNLDEPIPLRSTTAKALIDLFGWMYAFSKLLYNRLLGHASVQTTERYIGSKQKLQDAVNDRLGISVASDSA